MVRCKGFFATTSHPFGTVFKKRSKGLRATYHNLYGLLLFHRFGHSPWLLKMQCYFSRLQPTFSLDQLSPEIMQPVARHELLVDQSVIRLVSLRGCCVPRSLALCAHLHSLDLLAQFVLAGARNTVGGFGLHSCTGVAGRPINGPDELPQGSAIFTKILSLG